MASIPISSNDMSNRQDISGISFESQENTNQSLACSYEFKLVYLRKAYGIYFIENVIITIMMIISITYPQFQEFQRKNPIMPILFVVFLITFPICAMFCPKQMKIIPNNIILAICFTVSSSYLVTYLGSTTDTSSILLEMGMTTMMLLAFVIYLTFTKRNISITIGLIIVLLVSLTLLGIGYAFGFGLRSLIISFTISGLSGVYYIFQMLLCINERLFLFIENEYLFGSFLPYTDIFVFVLRICKLDKYTRMETH